MFCPPPGNIANKGQETYLLHLFMLWYNIDKLKLCK